MSKEDNAQSQHCERKTPREWAIAKGFLRLTPDGRVDYRKHTPWEFEATCRQQRWPDPLLDPTFKITAAEFEDAIKAMHVVSVPKTNQPAKG